MSERRLVWCGFFWGSHGCTLGQHEGVHRCEITWYPDPGGPGQIVACCEYDETADAEHRVRFMLHTGNRDPEWGQWGKYSGGWRQ